MADPVPTPVPAPVPVSVSPVSNDQSLAESTDPADGSGKVADGDLSKPEGTTVTTTQFGRGRKYFVPLLIVIAGELVVFYTTGAFDSNFPIYGWVSAGLIGVATLLAFITFVPNVHKAYPIFFGNRHDRVIPEGISLRNPFTYIRTVPWDRKPLTIEFAVTCTDGLTLTVQALVRYRPNAKLLTTVFVEYQEENLVEGVNAATERAVGDLAAEYKAETFIKMRRGLSLLANCRLRLAEMPHEEEDITANVLEWYTNKDNRKNVEEKLKQELKKQDKKKEDRETNSDVEADFGIDVLGFDFRDRGISFSKETQGIFELKAQADARVQAANALMTSIQVEAAKITDVEPGEAHRASLLAHGFPGFVLSGAGSSLPILPIPTGGSTSIPGNTPAQPASPPQKKRKGKEDEDEEENDEEEET